MVRQRMHVITVRFAPTENLGQRIQAIYDDDFIMPDGSWRLIETDPQTVQFSAILADLPIEDEVAALRQGLTDHFGDTWEIVSVGPEEDHRDLDPCFDYLHQGSEL